MTHLCSSYYRKTSGCYSFVSKIYTVIILLVVDLIVGKSHFMFLLKRTEQGTISNIFNQDNKSDLVSKVFGSSEDAHTSAIELF